MREIVGTHMGHLSPEHRARQAKKNARNRNRVHPESKVHNLDMPVPGSPKRINTRLWLKGSLSTGRQSR